MGEGGGGEGACLEFCECNLERTVKYANIALNRCPEIIHTNFKIYVRSVCSCIHSASVHTCVRDPPRYSVCVCTFPYLSFSGRPRELPSNFSHWSSYPTHKLFFLSTSLLFFHSISSSESVLYFTSCQNEVQKTGRLRLAFEPGGMMSLQRMLIGCQSWESKQGDTWAQWA